MRALFPLFLTGCCLAHMPADRDPRHLAIHWQPDLESARRSSERDRKPLLIVLIAGDLQESC